MYRFDHRQPEPKRVLIDSWPFFLEYFQKRTKTEARPNGMTWDVFQQLVKKAEKPVAEIKAGMQPLPTAEEVAEIVSLLNEIQTEQNKHHHLNDEQQQLLTDALSKANVFRQELAAAPEKLEKYLGAIEAVNNSLRTTGGSAIAAVDELRTRKATAEEMTTICDQLISPTGTVGKAVTELANAAPSIQATVQAISTLATNLVTKAKELRKALEQLEKKVDDPRVQRAKKKSLSIEERLEKAASSWEVAVAALINPWLAIAVILFRFFSGGDGGGGDGGGGNSSGQSGNTDGDSAEGEGEDHGEGSGESKESEGRSDEGEGKHDGDMTTEESDDAEDPFAVPEDSEAVEVKTTEGDHRIQLIRRADEMILIAWINGDQDRRLELGFNFDRYDPQEAFGKGHRALQNGTLTIDGLTPFDDRTSYPIDMQLSIEGEEDPIECRYKAAGADPILLGGATPSPVPSIEGEFRCRIEPADGGHRVILWRGGDANDHAILPLLFGLEADKELFDAAVSDRGLVLLSIGVSDSSQPFANVSEITLQWTLNEEPATYRFQPDGSENETLKWVMIVD